MGDDYASTFEALGLDSETLQMDHGETILPTVDRRPESILLSDKLRTLQVDDVESSDFRILEPLGEGGMGVVSLAEQTALRRLVAVKEPKRGDARSHGQVLDEAYIMGRIEHPNVVPAYNLGRHRDGQPLLAMKRVEGTSWEDVLSGKSEAPDGEEADLVWHLSVLLQVCNAVRFAHHKMIVHRDIKPENVMIGEFGEVYLLDWGIALSVDPEVEVGIPNVHSTGGIAGTPAFMAPEMTAADASEIDERTDVFLLGANLHMILTDEPPHSGPTMLSVLTRANKAEPPEYDSSVPSELAEIASKAMARDKKDRHQSVSEFSHAIADYMEHRASYSLSDSSAHLLDEIVDEDDSEERSRRLLEAEFGFRQALTIWDGNEDAKEGLQRALEERVRLSIANEEAGAARTAYGQLPKSNVALESEIEELETRLAARAERVDYLESFKEDLDLRRGTRSRQRAVIILGLGFGLLCFWQAWAVSQGQPEVPPEQLLQTFWRLLAIVSFGLVLFWKRLVSNLANKRLVALLMATMVGIFLARFAGAYLQPPVLYIQATEILVMGLMAFAVGAASSARLAAVGTLVYGGSLVATSITGSMAIAMLTLGFAHVTYFGFMAWIWRPARVRG